MTLLRALLLAAGLVSFSGPGLLPAQSPPPAPAQPPDRASVAVLRETIAQWVETERLLSEETQAWEARKASMAELLEVYRQELALLDEELSKAGQSAATFDADKTKLESQISAQRAARTGTARAIGKARGQLLELSKLFPPPLLETVTPDLDVLRGWKESDEDVRAGLQALLRTLEQAHRFATHISRSREIRDGQELEVIYLGVACAYYFGGDGTAGIGRPENGAWKWESRPMLRDRIAQIADQIEGDAHPRLLKLPVPARPEAPQP
jgi:hypothetical protein